MKAIAIFKGVNLHDEKFRFETRYDSIKDAVDWCKHCLGPAESRFMSFEVQILPADSETWPLERIARYSHLYRKLGNWCDPYFEY